LNAPNFTVSSINLSSNFKFVAIARGYADTLHVSISPSRPRLAPQSSPAPPLFPPFLKPFFFDASPKLFLLNSIEMFRSHLQNYSGGLPYPHGRVQEEAGHRGFSIQVRLSRRTRTNLPRAASPLARGNGCSLRAPTC
jgi:hypothetical protein